MGASISSGFILSPHVTKLEAKSRIAPKKKLVMFYDLSSRVDGSEVHAMGNFKVIVQVLYCRNKGSSGLDTYLRTMKDLLGGHKNRTWKE